MAIDLEMLMAKDALAMELEEKAEKRRAVK